MVSRSRRVLIRTNGVISRGPEIAKAGSMRKLANRASWLLVLTMALGACGQSQSDSATEGSRRGGDPGGSAVPDIPPSSSGPSTPSPGGAPSASAGTGGSSGTAPPGATTAPPAAPGPGTTNQPPQAGLLTAGTWDDNLNFDFFKSYRTKAKASQLPGLPDASIDDRLVVMVSRPDGTPVAGARVSLSGGQAELAHTQTGADGRALLFPAAAGVAAGAPMDISAEIAGVRQSVAARSGDLLVTLPLGAAAGPVAGLDVAVVIDTTGSMGDEIAYLQSELLNISAAVRLQHPDVSQRWAFVAYRDYQDDYVTRSFDLNADPELFRSSFGQLGAGGGGDYEEAPERGLADLNQLSWRDGPVARLAFWVGDAPHHIGREGELRTAITAAATRGVHVYPVSASGTDERLEFSMRLAAMLTGGRYLFLTNDSGIGGDHKEPTVPCYLVTTLQKAMHRMIEMELTGRHIDPVTTDVLRTGGNPQDGRCTLADGQVVETF
jgi:hypothetical protein